MKRTGAAEIILVAAIMSTAFGQTSWTISSPGNMVTATVQLANLSGTADYPAGARLYYSVSAGGPAAYSPVIQPSPMGLVRSDRNFVDGLTFVSEGTQRTIDSTYTMITGKRSLCRNYCNEKILTFVTSTGGALLQLYLRAYDDGFAFRYRFPETNTTSLTMTSEATGFRPPANSVMWMLPYNTTADAYAPAYEDRWQRNLAVGALTGTTAYAKPSDGTWCLPALLRTPAGYWALLWETDVTPSYCNSRLSAASQLVYRIIFPPANEWAGTGASSPSSPLPWATPWRVVIAGTSPGTILESTLSTDLATPCVLSDVSWIKPGRASWSWWSDNTSPQTYSKITPFIDLAQQMTWEYSCVDAQWNTMAGGTYQQLVAYGASKNPPVGITLWYNAGVPGGPTQAPTGRLYDSATRNNELTTISGNGVKGIKIDFWLSDKQAAVKYYFDVFRDAAKYHLLVDPHGNTIPRGWQRTYPNLITAEANRGAENYIWYAADCPLFPWSNSILPFTRNAVGSMDWTPVTFTNEVYAHQTSYAHELALSIIFESGVQHFADRVSGYQTPFISAGVQTFLKQVPTTWDDTKYLLGYPGSHVVLARRKGYNWYVGGIAGDTAKSVTVPLSFLAAGPSYQRTRIMDGASNTMFNELTDTTVSTGSITVNMPVHGGFVAKLVNLNPVAVGKPAAETKQAFRFSGAGIMHTMGRINLDPAYAGKTKSVAVYDLTGKLVSIKRVNKNSFDLRKDFGVPAGVYIVKVEPVR